jgi:hypothetical protein
MLNLPPPASDSSVKLQATHRQLVSISGCSRESEPKISTQDTSSVGQKWSTLSTHRIMEHNKISGINFTTCHCNNSLAEYGTNLPYKNNILLVRYPCMHSCWHFHMLSTRTLQCSIPGNCNITGTAHGSILCGCSATDTRHMACKLLAIVIINVFNTEIKTDNDISCFE